jgi:glycosyltransferase involved in cell wall biosynthesis
MKFGLSKVEVWVDGSFNSHRAGIGIDAQWVIDLISTKNEVRLIYYLPRSARLQREARRFRNLKSLCLNRPIVTPKKVRTTFFQPQFTSTIAGKNVTCWIVRVHDIFPITNPEWFLPWARLIFARSLKAAVNQRATIVCSSEHTRKVILTKYPEIKKNIFVLPCNPRKLSATKCEACDGCAQLRTEVWVPYILAVGTIEPRKGFEGLSKHWSNLLASDFPILIIIGRRGWKSRKIVSVLRRSERAGKVIWIADACDGALHYFYTHATAFISSSLDEGFNLPALEARANYNLPLILTDIPVHREHHSDSAHFYKSYTELNCILKRALVEPRAWETSKLPHQIDIFMKKFMEFNVDKN